MRRRLDILLVALGVARGALRATQPPEDEPESDTVDPRRRETGSPGWAEPLLAVLLLATAAMLLAFAVLIVADPDTQLLGATAGGGAALLAAALILAGKRVAPQETAVEARPPLAEPDQQAAVRAELASGGDGVSRRAVIVGAAGVAGAGLCAAVALPVTAIGPGTAGRTGSSPWRRGLVLVSETGEPIGADELDERSFVTAFPRGADRRDLGSPVVVVRVDPAALELPASRRGWAPEGILAFSKICTHAACAVSLYRSPQYEPLSRRPALVCPCHYSTFDPARAAKVVFGPAGRPLPQLPLSIDARRRLVAAGPMSGSVGPAWFGTKHPLP